MLKENDYHWFPLRIRNSSISRLQQMKDRLDAQKQRLEQQGSSFDTYTPLGFIKVSEKEMKLAPCLVNYIFVYSSFSELVTLKSNQELFEPLRFVMHPAYSEDFKPHNEVLYISDRSMHDFMRVTKERNDKVIFLDNMDYASKVSQAVQITQGEFTGVIGRIKRIRGKRCVVLLVGHEMAAAVVDVPSKYLRYLNDEEYSQLEEEYHNK